MKIIYKKLIVRTGGLWLLFWFFMAHAFAQEYIVSGKVTEMESGTPLPGVNILVKGSTTGTGFPSPNPNFYVSVRNKGEYML